MESHGHGAAPDVDLDTSIHSTLVAGVTLPGSGIVIGPPGSGKTVLAMQLAGRAANLLHTDLVVASEHLVGWLRPRVSRSVGIKTWRNWLHETYADAVGGRTPQRNRNGVQGIDWMAVLEGIERATPVNHRQILVDESQDVPHRLLAAMRRHARNVIAFADPLQRHNKDGSSLDQLVDALSLEHPWPVLVLEEDFRTTREIQDFAVSAWAPERLDPSRPARATGPLPRVVNGTLDYAAAEAERLLTADIGTVMVASAHADRGAIVGALRERNVPVNRGSRSDPDKVSVLAFEALRGLEFDAVVLVPPGQLLGTWQEMSADRYVAATRARRELTVIMTGSTFPELAQSLEVAGKRLGLSMTEVAS